MSANLDCQLLIYFHMWINMGVHASEETLKTCFCLYIQKYLDIQFFNSMYFCHFLAVKT